MKKTILILAIIFLFTSATYNEINVESLEATNVMTILSDKIDLDDSNFVSDYALTDSDDDDDNIIIYAESVEGDNFIVDEFTEYDQHPTEETVRKIKEVHIPELQKIRDKINKPIIIRSASRSYQHELKMGRSGKSQHVYSRGCGAVDVSLMDFSRNNLNELEKEIIDDTSYKRITRYKTFLHLDFAKNRYGERAYYRNTDHGWIFISELDE